MKPTRVSFLGNASYGWKKLNSIVASLLIKNFIIKLSAIL